MSQSSDSIGFDDLPEFETENDSTDEDAEDELAEMPTAADD